MITIIGVIIATIIIVIMIVSTGAGSVEQS